MKVGRLSLGRPVGSVHTAVAPLGRSPRERHRAEVRPACRFHEQAARHHSIAEDGVGATRKSVRRCAGGRASNSRRWQCGRGCVCWWLLAQCAFRRRVVLTCGEAGGGQLAGRRARRRRRNSVTRGTRGLSRSGWDTVGRSGQPASWQLSNLPFGRVSQIPSDWQRRNRKVQRLITCLCRHRALCDCCQKVIDSIRPPLLLIRAACDSLVGTTRCCGEAL